MFVNINLKGYLASSLLYIFIVYTWLVFTYSYSSLVSVAVLAEEKHKSLKLLEDTLKDEGQLHGWTGAVKVIKLNDTNPITALDKGRYTPSQA